jgi:hypothetical protein
MSLPTHNSRLMLWPGVLITTCITSLLLASCHPPRVGRLEERIAQGPTGRTQEMLAAYVSWDITQWMAAFAYVPGVLCLIGAAVFPAMLGPLARVARVLIGLGIGCALVPRLSEWVLGRMTKQAEVLVWCLVTAVVVILGYKVVFWITVWHRDKTIQQRGKSAKHAGARAAIARINNPYIDKAFRHGRKAITPMES